MITLLIGKKGSGKTKRLIDLANNAVETSKGCVVVLEKELKMTYNISHRARLVDTDAYGIHCSSCLYGFICGICAGNYDVTDLLVDSTLKITETDASGIVDLVERLEKLSGSDSVNFTLSISAAEEAIPTELHKYIAKG